MANFVKSNRGKCGAHITVFVAGGLGVLVTYRFFYWGKPLFIKYVAE